MHSPNQSERLLPEAIIAGIQRPGPAELTTVLDLGGAILDQIYEGAPEGWRNPDSVSLRALAREAGVSVSTIYRYVAVADLWRRCGRPTLSHVGVSHLRQLLPLNRDTQAALLNWAEDERWTVSETRMVAHMHQRRPDSAGRGRPPQAPIEELTMDRVRQWRARRRQRLENARRLGRPETRHLLDTLVLARDDGELNRSPEDERRP